jgi:hypothetical protein
MPLSFVAFTVKYIEIFYVLLPIIKGEFYSLKDIKDQMQTSVNTDTLNE